MKAHRFQKGSRVGRPKGALGKRTIVGIEAARAMSGRAFDRLVALIDARSHRIALEASRLVLAYAWGAPRQTLELTGNFGDLSRELTAALQEARARRAALDAAPPVAALSAAPDALPAFLATPAPIAAEKPLTPDNGQLSEPRTEAPE